ncbi:hypothetical protein [Streptomyces noursei]|uniref:hypothetical protein n=1 Tax=Streptomyces noursei TaxID=1971 RepID=UPI001678FBDF|nr:hypothetical protein [Streptomyces noursei]MCZ1017380.1 hypothetical protein [Streptomyces noursei]GGX18724.1 hypothetical protein GCM10010341_45100 [Streptomyces noursei]
MLGQRGGGAAERGPFEGAGEALREDDGEAALGAAEGADEGPEGPAAGGIRGLRAASTRTPSAVNRIAR